MPAGTQHESGRNLLEAELLAWWGEVLGLMPSGTHQDFFQLGGDPQRGQRLLDQVKRHHGVAIPLSELYEARTIDKLADLIEMKKSASEQLCIVPIQPRGYRRPLFLVHGVGGNILGFASLARSLHPDQPVYGIQAQALQGDGPTLINLEEMAGFYVEQLRRVQPAGPYALLGFSFGGLVAYEMAQQLAASGGRVDFLGMLDTWQPGYLQRVVAQQPRIRRGLDRLRLVRLNTRKLSMFQLVPYIYLRLKGRALRLAYGRMAASGAVTLPDSMRKVRDINLMAGERYQVKPYRGRVTLFRAQDGSAVNLPDDLDWGKFAGEGVGIIRLPGDHGQILAEPNLSFMAARLQEQLGSMPHIQTPTSDEREEFEIETGSIRRVDSGPEDHPPQVSLQHRGTGVAE